MSRKSKGVTAIDKLLLQLLVKVILMTTRRNSYVQCVRSNPLYRCEVFKSKSPEERGEFVERKRICFNCINWKDHNSRSCKSPVRCKSLGCGKLHHTLLHRSTPPVEKKRKADTGTNTYTQNSAHKNSSNNVNLASEQSNEILLQEIPLRSINDDGSDVTTYGLIDSGSDVTMIDPSLVELLGLQGITGNLSLSTVNAKDRKETGIKVNFKVAPIEDPNNLGIDIRGAWAIKELDIPLKPYSVIQRDVGQWPQL